MRQPAQQDDGTIRASATGEPAGGGAGSSTISTADRRVVVAGKRASLQGADFKKAVLEHLTHTCAKEIRDASAMDFYYAFAHTVRDRLVQRWLATQRTYLERDVKRAYYLSSEFLTGRSLGLCLMNLGLYETAETLAGERGFDLGAILEQEGDPGPRQRRPRAAGRLLHGLAGDARAARGRLRHPLRLRHLRAAHRGRPAGRAPRQLAAAGQPVGAAAPRGRADRALLRPRRDAPRRQRAAASPTGSTRAR